MKNKLKKTAAAAVAVSVMLTAAACNYETAASETTQGIPGEPTSSTVDYSEYTFETMYGSQLIGYLDHQYYFEGQPIPLAESNYYFIDAFLLVLEEIDGQAFSKRIIQTQEDHIRVFEPAVIFSSREIVHIDYGLIIARSFREIFRVSGLYFQIENSVVVLRVDVESDAF